LHANVPNPFNPSTRFAYDLPRRAQVALDIFDSAGRRVRRIAGGWQEAGSHEAPWDGRDDQGRAAPGGVYFARLAVDRETRTRKLVLLR
jgi:flagellar hook assembly protein FlgD